jgi:hypothetical protein
MATSEVGRKKQARERKYKALVNELRKIDPKSVEQFQKFVHEVAETWKDSPFVGEEEEGFGASRFRIDNNGRFRGMPIDIITWFTLFKVTSDKFDEMFNWFRENRPVLEMIVKEYMAQGENR